MKRAAPDQIEIAALELVIPRADAGDRRRYRARLAELRREARQHERAHRCPRCGCSGGCTILLADDGGEGRCVPRGVLGLRACSRCLDS